MEIEVSIQELEEPPSTVDPLRFFSLAIVLAVALGSTTECFFALLATPPSQAQEHVLALHQSCGEPESFAPDTCFFSSLPQGLSAGDSRLHFEIRSEQFWILSFGNPSLE